MKLLIDCDEVLCAFVDGYLNVVHEHTGRAYTARDITTWDLSKCVKLTADEKLLIESDIRAPGFCSSLAAIPGAKEGLARLRNHADVLVVTTPLRHAPYWCGERIEWLEKHFGIGLEGVAFVTDKTLIRGSILVDDRPENVRAFNEGGIGILWDAPHNQNEPDLLRVHSWDELLKVVQRFNGEFDIHVEDEAQPQAC